MKILNSIKIGNGNMVIGNITDFDIVRMSFFWQILFFNIIIL